LTSSQKGFSNPVDSMDAPAAIRAGSHDAKTPLLSCLSLRCLLSLDSNQGRKSFGKFIEIGMRFHPQTDEAGHPNKRTQTGRATSYHYVNRRRKEDPK